MLGKTYDEIVGLPVFKDCPFTICKNANDGKCTISVEIDGATKLYKPEEILSHLFKSLYSNAKDATGEEHSVVLCTPADTRDQGRMELKSAAIIAGINVLRVMNEPTAALVNFTNKLPPFCRCLVVRLGSLVTDVSLFELDDGVYEILDHKQHHFSVDKLDQLLVEYFINGSLKQFQLSDRNKSRLLKACKYIKHGLSNNLNVKYCLDIGENTVELEITRARFENMIREQVSELVAFINPSQQFDKLFITGGGASIPYVISAIESELGMKAYASKIDPSEIICKGAGMQSSILTHSASSYTTTEYIPVPNRKVKGCGLYNNDSPLAEAIPATHSEVNISIVDLFSHVSVTQSFYNKTEDSVEAIYLFPVEPMAAVCGFEVKIGDKEYPLTNFYQGIVKEKEKAFQRYDEAISESHGAFLMEKVDDEIFQVSIGNLPPNTSTSITIKYISTLENPEKNTLVFNLPTIIGDVFKMDNSTPGSIISPSSININCEFSSTIKSMSSPSHQINTKELGNNKHQITLAQGQLLDRKFSLNIVFDSLAEHVAWISNDSNYGLPVALLSIEVPQKMIQSRNEYVFVIDRSGSMCGRIQQAKAALLLFVKSLPHDCYFRFGSSFEKLFRESRLYNEESVGIALSHLDKLDANLGGTEILEPLKSVLQEPSSPCDCRKVILVTDGEVHNTAAIVNYVRYNKKNAQIYTLGIGADCSRELILQVAKAGDGFHDFVTNQEPMGPKVIKMLKSTNAPVISNISVSYSTSQASKIEASVASSFYQGDKLLTYVKLDADNYPPEKFEISTTLFGDNLGVAHSTVVGVQEHNLRKDNLVQLLSAHSEIKRLEQAPNLKGLLELSLAFNLLSSVSSFVVVEKQNTSVQGSMQLESKMRKSGTPLYTLQTVTRSYNTCDLLLLDVTPLDVGFYDGKTHYVVIPRNSTIPTKKSTDFTYANDPDSSHTLGIYEQKSNLLQSVPVPVSPSESNVLLKVTFEIDANGILKVAIENQSTGQVESATIANDKQLSKAEIEALLQATEASKSGYTSTTSLNQPKANDNSTMLAIVRLQKFDGLWELDNDFISIFGEKAKLNINKEKIHHLIDTGKAIDEVTDKLWATTLAISYFYSILSQKEEWELIVDKALARMRFFISDEEKLKQVLEIGETELKDIELISQQTNSFVSSSSTFNYGSNSGPTVTEVD